MKVVCAACKLHYADLDPDMEFGEMLVYSDALAEWHGPWCGASRDEHAAALAMMEAVVEVQEGL